MVTSMSYNKDLLGNEIRGTNISYWGLSALKVCQDDTAKYLFRDCVVHDKYKGVIIGLGDNNQCFDYYYIVYVPELNKVVYQLCNDSKFIKSIEL